VPLCPGRRVLFSYIPPGPNNVPPIRATATSTTIALLIA
jgi:hypothetical protein